MWVPVVLDSLQLEEDIAIIRFPTEEFRFQVTLDEIVAFDKDYVGLTWEDRDERKIRISVEEPLNDAHISLESLDPSLFMKEKEVDFRKLSRLD